MSGMLSELDEGVARFCTEHGIGFTLGRAIEQIVLAARSLGAVRGLALKMARDCVGMEERYGVGSWGGPERSPSLPLDENRLLDTPRPASTFGKMSHVEDVCVYAPEAVQAVAEGAERRKPGPKKGWKSKSIESGDAGAGLSREEKVQRIRDAQERLKERKKPGPKPGVKRMRKVAEGNRELRKVSKGARYKVCGVCGKMRGFPAFPGGGDVCWDCGKAVGE